MEIISPSTNELGQNAVSTSILEIAAEKIARFNDEGLHYNIAACHVYEERRTAEDLFGRLYLRHLIAGLTVFDLGRMMGSNKFNFESGFAARLVSKLNETKPFIEPLLRLNLLDISLQEHGNAIIRAYEILSAKGSGALHENQKKSFHVGATKVLHFLNPELFIIVDSNAARAFRLAWKVPFRNTTQPGYSAERYIECMKRAQIDILAYGVERFRALELNTPITRIYDKLTFITGQNT